jgi:putative glutamine amidotransferase
MARHSQRPLIGVTGPKSGSWGPRICAHLSLLLCGGRPLHLRPGDPLDTTSLDGVVISGGHDVDPVLYKARAQVASRYDAARDVFESAIIDSAVADRTPLLGICRGAQLLNVRLGGTLLQSLRQIRRQTSNRRTVLPLKTLCVEPHTKLLTLLAATRLRINSLHNQSIDVLGEGLQVAARDLDGIVQAVEHRERRFLVGVQWHPEFLFYSWRHRALFRELVRAAGEYAEGRNRDS